VTQESVRAALAHVIDPEVGIDIVELGLVYAIEIADAAVSVQMTMTSPACPLGDYLIEQAEAAIRDYCPDVSVELVWEPPWSPERMGSAAKDRLG
jgi:metal-sulfur cluster biosynthetic enzyme